MHNDYIIRYKPPIYNGNDTMDNLYRMENQEIKQANQTVMKVFDNCFVKTSDVDGIYKHEQIYNVIPNSKFTLEQRRENVLNKMFFVPPFTRQKLDKCLFNIYGQGGYVFEIYPNDYKIIIDIKTDDPIVYLQFNKDVRNVIPANMELIFAIQYTYIYLNRHKTHEQMSKLTYGELSQFSKGVK